MIYVYIFEDGNMVQTNEGPSEDDLKSVFNGVLEILMIDGTIVCLDHDNKTYEIEKK